MNRRTPPTRAQLTASMAAALVAGNEASLRAAIGELLQHLGYDGTLRLIDQLRGETRGARQFWIVESHEERPRSV